MYCFCTVTSTGCIGTLRFGKGRVAQKHAKTCQELSSIDRIFVGKFAGPVPDTSGSVPDLFGKIKGARRQAFRICSSVPHLQTSANNAVQPVHELNIT